MRVFHFKAPTETMKFYELFFFFFLGGGGGFVSGHKKKKKKKTAKFIFFPIYFTFI